MKCVAEKDIQPNIASLRGEYLTTLTSAQADQCSEIAYSSHQSHYDSIESFYDNLELFNAMDTLKTPEQGPCEEPDFDGTLPRNMPVFSDMDFQQCAAAPAVHGNPSQVAASTQDTDSAAQTVDQPNPAITDPLGKLPEPPRSKRPRRSPDSELQVEGDLMRKLTSLEAKVDSLNRKVVDTAQEQSADIKKQLQRLEAAIESNTTAVQDYSKSLALVLQGDIAKVLDTVNAMGNTAGPRLSPAGLQALVTLSSETMKLYQQEYKP